MVKTYCVPTGSYPVFAHGCGAMKTNVRLYERARRVCFARQVETGPHGDLTIVTVHNGTDHSIVEEWAKLYNVNIMVVRVPVKKWEFRYKLEFVLDNLRFVDTKYIMYLDAWDVVLINDMRQCVPGFLRYGCKMLFGGEEGCWPRERIKFGTGVVDFEELKKWSAGKYKYPMQHLNSGCWMGETDYCKEFLRVWRDKVVAMSEGGRVANNQMAARVLQPEYWPEVRVDDHGLLFLNLFDFLQRWVNFKEEEDITYF